MSTEHVVVRTIPKHFHGRDPRGLPFTAVRWQYTECVNCRWKGVVKFYVYEGREDWIEHPEPDC